MYSKVTSIIICILMLTTFFSAEVPKDVNDQVMEEEMVVDDKKDNSDDLVDAPLTDLNGNNCTTNINERSSIDGLDKFSSRDKEGPGMSSSGASGLADSPWPMFRQNVNHTGLSPFDTSLNLGKEKWNFTTGGFVYSSPAIGPNGIIYVGSNDCKLYAINTDGSEEWNFTTDLYALSSPAVDSNGTIYIGSSDGKLYAINPDGTEKWNFIKGPRGSGYSSPAVSNDGTIYIGSSDHKIYAIYPDGSEKWSYLTDDMVISSPAIGSDGTIYIGSNDDRLYAINPDGTKEWSFTTSGNVHSSPAIGTDNIIYFGSWDGKLYAVYPNGTEKWSFLTYNIIISSPAIGLDGTIYVGSHDNRLYAIKPDGTEKWNFTTDEEVYSSPAISIDGTIYVASENGTLYAINSDGTKKWSFTIDGEINSSPAINSDGTIYIGSNNYKLYAIGSLNILPIAVADPDQTKNECESVQFNASTSYDPDGTIESYEWDFDSSDGLWWETGAPPDATGPTPTYIYGDDGIYVTTLRVTDNDNLSATDTCNITVQNVDSTVSIESVIMNLEIGLRVAGRKYNNVSMTLFEDDTNLGSVSIERQPGSPNIQMAWIPVSIDFSKLYSANVTYTPKDPPNIGANPVWIYIRSANGTINQIHHTFNVQQSKKRNSEHWNHIEPWEIELNPHFVGLDFEITSQITDPGSDDDILTFTYGSQNLTVTYLNNPPNPDLYPSPEVNPVDILDTTTLIYEGPGTITLVVKDDDNIRLGIGQGSDSFII